MEKVISRSINNEKTLLCIYKYRFSKVNENILSHLYWLRKTTVNMEKDSSSGLEVNDSSQALVVKTHGVKVLRLMENCSVQRKTLFLECKALWIKALYKSSEHLRSFNKAGPPSRPSSCHFTLGFSGACF